MLPSEQNFSPIHIEHPNARARFLYARELFRTAESVEFPSSQTLIDQHEEWLRSALAAIGIDGPNTKYLSNVFRDKKVDDKRFKKDLHRIEVQARQTTDNILQAILWYEVPEISSWNEKRIKFRSVNAIHDQENARRYMITRQRTGGRSLSDWNSSERYKSLIVGYYPDSGEPEQTSPLFTLVVNEHYVGVQGSFDYTNTERQHIGVKGYFDPQAQVIEIGFEGYSDFYGWDQIDGQPIYKLTYVRNMIRDLQDRLKSGQQGFIGLGRWRSG